ncbi:hypothetical protein KRX19_03350 [Cardiobacteriaceae bacterium TAE3-ERU3]|nr:hypothetical protein [Cardiobacteriaceae bacterium TAE3-ERU3]
MMVASVHAETSMATVLDEANISQCRSELIAAADAVIGKNIHRLYLPPLQVGQDMPAIAGIIAYHDRHAQVRFQAQMADGLCRINVRESYTFSDACPTIRTEVFKRWDLLGKLDEYTWVLQKAKRVRYPQTAYLSDAIRSHTSCLVTVDSDITAADLAKAEEH